MQFSNLDRAFDLLDQERPRPGKPDRRFEWFYWMRTTHPEARVRWLPIAQRDSFAAPRLSPDGRLFVIVEESFSRRKTWLVALDPEAAEPRPYLAMGKARLGYNAGAEAALMFRPSLIDRLRGSDFP